MNGTNKNPYNGVVLIDKKEGQTTNDIVCQVRDKFGMKKVGHGGTLEPFASGVLVVLLGQSTKRFEKISKMDKEYIVNICLGQKTDTGDSLGLVIEEKDNPERSQEEIKETLQSFKGGQKQISDRGEKDIYITSLKIRKHNTTTLELKIKVSSNTYLRQLADDICQRLGTVGYIRSIIRTRLGEFSIKECRTLEELDTSHILSKTSKYRRRK